MMTFRDKYRGIPGDFREATRFWNRQTADGWCASSHGLSSAGSPGVCDGNADGMITVAVAASQSGENYQFWRQLALAGLIEGTFSGLTGSGGRYDSNRENSPVLRIANAGISIYYRSGGAGTSEIVQLSETYGNSFLAGTFQAGDYSSGVFLTPSDLWNLDTKMDDGRPFYGNVIARHWQTCTTATGNTNADRNADYRLTTTAVACSMYYRNLF